MMNFLGVTLMFSPGNLYHVFIDIFCRSTRCHVLKHLGFQLLSCEHPRLLHPAFAVLCGWVRCYTAATNNETARNIKRIVCLPCLSVCPSNCDLT